MQRPTSTNINFLSKAKDFYFKCDRLLLHPSEDVKAILELKSLWKQHVLDKGDKSNYQKTQELLNQVK